MTYADEGWFEKDFTTKGGIERVYTPKAPILSDD